MTKGKVVLFGGSGFIGSHVADELSNQGYKVTIFDLSPSKFLRPDQEMITGDILDKRAVDAVCVGADYVYNFAGLADINDAKNKPELTVQLNIVGNLNILEGARKANVKRFVFASTVYVYSESGSFYRVSKQTSEKIIELYYEKYGLPYTILRFGSLYGRRSDNRNAIHRFITQAVTTGEIHYQGTGDELREYIHTQDAAVASVKILDQEFANQHLVLTGHQSMRVKDVLLMVTEILHKKVDLKFENSKVDAHYNFTPYAYKPRLGKKFVVNPFIDMGQGILDCIDEISSEIEQRK